MSPAPPIGDFASHDPLRLEDIVASRSPPGPGELEVRDESKCAI